MLAVEVRLRFGVVMVVLCIGCAMGSSSCLMLLMGMMCTGCALGFCSVMLGRLGCRGAVGCGLSRFTP